MLGRCAKESRALASFRGFAPPVPVPVKSENYRRNVTIFLEFTRARRPARGSTTIRAAPSREE